MALAKENGVEMSPEIASRLYTELHKRDELSEEDLDAVAGGKGQAEPEKGEEHPAPKYKGGDNLWVIPCSYWGVIETIYWSPDFECWIYSLRHSSWVELPYLLCFDYELSKSALNQEGEEDGDRDP